MTKSKYKIMLKGTVDALSEALPYSEAVAVLMALRVNNAHRMSRRTAALYLVKTG